MVTDLTKCTFDKLPLCWKSPRAETIKVKIYNSMSLVGMAFFIFLLTFLKSPDQKLLAMCLLTGAVSILGFNVGSFFKSTTLVAQAYSSIVMGMVQCTTIVVLIILPYATGPIIAQGTFEEWRIVFYVASTMLFMGNVVFVILGSGEPAKWAKKKRGQSR